MNTLEFSFWDGFQNNHTPVHKSYGHQPKPNPSAKLRIILLQQPTHILKS